MMRLSDAAQRELDSIDPDVYARRASFRPPTQAQIDRLMAEWAAEHDPSGDGPQDDSWLTCGH